LQQALYFASMPRNQGRSDQIDEPARNGSSSEAAHYIMARTQELSALARAHSLEMLAYLLDMARMEAEQALRRSGERG
jgi:hypothetical protein